MRASHHFGAPVGAVLLAVVLGAAACDRPQAATNGSPGAAGSIAYAGPFTAQEAEDLRARWDYVSGWFGGDLMRFGHLNVESLVRTVALDGGEAVRPVRDATRAEVASYMVETRDRGAVTLDEYVTADDRVDGFIVMHRGDIVYERYVQMGPEDRHLYWSISKMMAGLLVSMLQDEGLIDTTESVERYLPELASSGWAGVTVRNVLDMASGIDCPEDAAAYADIESCMLVMERSVGLQPDLPTVSFAAHMAGMAQREPQGTRYEYASANTSLLMRLAETVTGQRYPDLLSQRVWRHVGAEGEVSMVSGDYEQGEAAAAHGGLVSTLRDLGRLGLFVLEQERFHEKLLEDARPELFPPPAFETTYASAGSLPTHAAWQCDVVFPDGDFGKGGWGGQFLYVSPRRDLVIAWLGTFGEDLVEPDLQSVARQLATAPGLWSGV
jgi:CubicO group peptidase (beta-lactamase class C family)